MKIEKRFEIEIYGEVDNIENTDYYYLLNSDLIYDYSTDKIIALNNEITKLPYIETVLGTVNNDYIEKVFIKSSCDMNIITTDLGKFITVLGNESLSILAADTKLPSFKRIPELDLYSNTKILYRAVYKDIAIYIRRKLLADAFRFKVEDKWFKIVDDILEEAEQPMQSYDSNTIYGFCIIRNEEIKSIFEAGTVY